MAKDNAFDDPDTDGTIVHNDPMRHIDKSAFDDRGMGPEMAAIANALMTAMQQAGPKGYKPGRLPSKNVIDRRPGRRTILEMLGDRATTSWSRSLRRIVSRVPELDMLYPKGVD